MAVNKVIKSDGTTLIDITGTTATASDVAQGKVFYGADGTEQTGTAVMGGGSAISVVDTTDSHGGTIRTITAVDLSADTVTAATLMQGYTAHDRLGNAITGTASGGSEFIITLTKNASTGIWEPDCTYAEMYAAYTGGKTIAVVTDAGAPTQIHINTEPSFNCAYTVDDDLVDISTGTYGINSRIFSWTSAGVSLLDEFPMYDAYEADAVPADVASGKVFYNASGKQTGTATGASLQAKTNISPTTSSQTITADSGYDGLASVQINAMPGGTAGTPTATKGTVSNHSVTVTPSVTNSTGYITGGTKTGTAVTVSASELVSGSETKTANGTYDVTNLASLVVNVPTGGGDGKNAQIALGVGRVASSSYAEVSGQSITVSKTGTYDVYWCGWRTSTSGTSGSQLYINGTAYGSAQTSFSSFSNAQTVHLSNVSLTQGQTIAVRARSRNTSYYMYIYNLTIIEA